MNIEDSKLIPRWTKHYREDGSYFMMLIIDYENLMYPRIPLLPEQKVKIQGAITELKQLIAMHPECVPRMIESVCPKCGKHSGASDLTCPKCGHLTDHKWEE